ncbi:cytochrome P450 monooxygenase [Aspergillus spinulosporus]
MVKFYSKLAEGMNIHIGTYLGVALGSAILYAILLSVYRLKMHPLAKYPGPKIAAITRAWHAHHLICGTAVQAFFDAHKKYGPVVRVAPDELIFTSSQAWDDIYGSRNGQGEMGKETPMYQNPTAFHNITTADRQTHRLYRRLLSKGFSMSNLRDNEPVLQEKLSLLITRLHDYATKGAVVEMTSWYNYFTFDAIGELAFGEPFGCLENSNYHPWVSMIFEAIKYSGVAQALGYYPLLFKILLRFVPKSLQQKSKAHRSLTSEKVQRRLDSNIDRNDLTSNLFKPENKLERYQIDGNCSIIIIGGSETTATALSAVTYYLSRNKDTKDKVVHEVLTAFSCSSQIDTINTGKLLYMEACLNEALRKFPPGPVTFPRRVPKGGSLIDGNWVPGGSQVGISIFCANNSAQNFKDPEKFAPERWMNSKEYDSDDRHAMQTFSYGPRNCIGQNLARMEMRLALARFIWEFDWDLAPGSEDWDKTRVYQTWDKKPLNIRLRPRSR